MNKKNEIKYIDAMKRIEEILLKIETDHESVDIDGLIAEIEEAAHLISHCKSKLFNTEAKIQKILDSLEEEDKSK